MKQKIINKVFFVSAIREGKVLEILKGKVLEDLVYRCKTKFHGCDIQVMEYNDEYNVYIPDIEEHLMMIRRRIENSFSK